MWIGRYTEHRIQWPSRSTLAYNEAGWLNVVSTSFTYMLMRLFTVYTTVYTLRREVGNYEAAAILVNV